MTDGRSKMLVAYHEVGHAVCATLTAGHDPVQKVTLIPRGQARGLTWFIPGGCGWLAGGALNCVWPWHWGICVLCCAAGPAA